MGLKLLLALAVAAGCALIGRSYAGSGLRRAALLGQLADDVQLLRIRMLEQLAPLQTALEGAQSPALRRVGAAMAGIGAAAAWERVRGELTAHGAALDCLAEADLAALDALFAGLGASGRAEQEALLAGTRRALERLAEAARAGSAEKSRLYTTLGLLAGLAMALMLF